MGDQERKHGDPSTIQAKRDERKGEITLAKLRGQQLVDEGIIQNPESATALGYSDLTQRTLERSRVNTTSNNKK